MLNRFGTTEDMIIQEIDEQGVHLRLAIDERGLYLTRPLYVGKPIADPNRYSTVRQDVSRRLRALNLDPRALWEANQHRIQVIAAVGKKVNPLKASKRRAHSA